MRQKASERRKESTAGHAACNISYAASHGFAARENVFAEFGELAHVAGEKIAAEFQQIRTDPFTYAFANPFRQRFLANVPLPDAAHRLALTKAIHHL